MSSGNLSWECEKGAIAPRGAAAAVFRSDISDLFLPLLMPQSLMAPPDAMKSTLYLILGQEHQPEWTAPCDRAATGTKALCFVPRSVSDWLLMQGTPI